MPNAYPLALRERAVRAYEAGAGSYEALAEQFEVSISSLLRWVTQVRSTGDVTPRARGGGWHSPVEMAVLEQVIADQPDATCEELRRAYARRVGRAKAVSRSAIVRAVHRAGFVLKKNARPSEVDRPDVRRKRAAFVRWVRTIDPRRLVVLDEAGANLAMGRSHAWVRRGQEYVEPRPMNWGDNLTLIGAIRRTGWVTLNTKWRAVNTPFFVDWVRRRLAPRLRPHDVVLLDNLKAHRDPASVGSSKPGARCCGTCRRTPMTSIPSSPRGDLSSATFAPTLLGPPPPCAASRNTRDTSSVARIVSTGLPMRAMVNRSDLRD